MAANLLFDRLANGDIEEHMPGEGGEDDGGKGGLYIFICFYFFWDGLIL